MSPLVQSLAGSIYDALSAPDICKLKGSITLKFHGLVLFSKVPLNIWNRPEPNRGTVEPLEPWNP